MAKIGQIYIGGSENTEFISSVVFFLNQKSSISKAFNFSGKWEVELRKDHGCIVARCIEDLSIDEILTNGLKYTQKALDLLSVEKYQQYTVINPGERYLILWRDNKKYILRNVEHSTLGVGMQVAITKKDKDGNVIPNPPKTLPDWIPAFRYYRLSQSSTDIYEAYRNLFLGLESILNEICPKRNERERKWLTRALNKVNKQTSLSAITPNNVNKPVQYIVKELYKDIRCNLFHAKNKSILPFEDINPTSVSKAYEKLIRLWRIVAAHYFNVTSGGGVMTYQGFKLMMDNVFKNTKLNLYATNDNTPPKKTDNKISPLGKKVIPFSNSTYKGELSPGYALLSSQIKDNELKRIDLIHRICSTVNDNMISICYFDEALYPSNIDIFENHEIFAMENKSTYKSNF